MNAHIGMAQIAAAKLQHHVIYVSDLQRSTDFYTKLFDLQFSALNHPDSSAAMRLAHMEMHFFSFGFYHHDICLVKHHKLKMDNGSMLHFSHLVTPFGQRCSLMYSRQSSSFANSRLKSSTE